MAPVSIAGRLCQAWFAAVVLCFALWLRAVTTLIHLARPLTRQSVAEACHTCTFCGSFKTDTAHAALVFKATLFLCPWIQLKTVDGKPLRWPARSQPPPFFVMNHTSMMDFFVWSASLPLRVCRETSLRTMVSAKMLKLPVCGEVLRLCGTFPVHFVKDDVGVYSVDKAKQANVSEDVNAHIASGGSIGLCPEGQLSRHPPTPLLPFRRGSFAVPTANAMPVWGFAMVGCHECWPLAERVGGLPSTIVLALKLLHTPREGELPAEVADACQRKMQALVERVAAHRDGLLGGADASRKKAA